MVEVLFLGGVDPGRGAVVAVELTLAGVSVELLFPGLSATAVALPALSGEAVVLEDGGGGFPGCGPAAVELFRPFGGWSGADGAPPADLSGLLPGAPGTVPAVEFLESPPGGPGAGGADASAGLSESAARSSGLLARSLGVCGQSGEDETVLRPECVVCPLESFTSKVIVIPVAIPFGKLRLEGLFTSEKLCNAAPAGLSAFLMVMVYGGVPPLISNGTAPHWFTLPGTATDGASLLATEC